MSMIPRDAVACNYAGCSYLYYVCSDGTLSWIEGPSQDSSEDKDKAAKPWKGYSDPVRIAYNDSGEKRAAIGNTDDPTLAVVNYQMKNETGQDVSITRLFYVDPSHELCEARWEGSPDSPGGKWTRGELSFKPYIKTQSNSLLAAVEDGSTIKVYFQDEEGGNNLSVAWAPRDMNSREAWKKRVITQKF